MAGPGVIGHHENGCGIKHRQLFQLHCAGKVDTPITADQSAFLFRFFFFRLCPGNKYNDVRSRLQDSLHQLLQNERAPMTLKFQHILTGK